MFNIYKQRGRSREFRPRAHHEQKAGDEDGRSRRQSTEHSIQKEGLMWKINKMKEAVVRQIWALNFRLKLPTKRRDLKSFK